MIFYCFMILGIFLKTLVFDIHFFLFFAGITAQCPTDFAYLGGKCLLFLLDALSQWEDADPLCRSFNATLAKIDDCSLLTEIGDYIDKYGE